MALRDFAIQNYSRRNFNATNAINPALAYMINYFLVAGGGGGGWNRGGGGGGGGLITGNTTVNRSFSLSIVIGGGGSGGQSSGQSGANGQNSSITFSPVNIFTAIGGGGGGGDTSPYSGLSGGSGGGSNASGPTNTGISTPGQGNVGGSGSGPTGTGGGGGGYNSAGTPGSGGGTGGSGYSNSIITGTSLTYAAGGTAGGPSAGNGALGIVNTGSGGGGGGGGGYGRGDGASGVAVISYSSPVQTGLGGYVYNNGANTTGSVSFSGSGRLTVPANTNLDITGDFTIEMWVNPTANTGASSFAMFNTGSGSHTVESTINIYNSSKFNLQAAGDVYVLTSTTTVQQNTWYHLAVTRQGSTARLFVNGNLEASNTTAFTFQTGYPWYLGDRPASAANGQIPFSGWISNFRAIKGTALYTSNFTPPTSPLTAVANTTLLTCQDSTGSTYHDNSSYNWSISSTGQTITSFQPISSNVNVVLGSVGANLSGGFATTGANTYYHIFTGSGTFTA